MKSWKSLLLAFLFLLVTAHAEEIRLKDGTVLQGKRIAVQDSLLTFRTSLGDLRIPISQITDVRPAASAPQPPRPVLSSPPPVPSAPVSTPSSPPAPPSESMEEGAEDPGGHSLVLMPTAFTPPQGTASFVDFQLFFLTLNYSPTASTVISGGVLFPVVPSLMEAFTVGVKQGLFIAPDARSAIAVTGSFTKMAGEVANDLSFFWSANLVGSVAFSGTDGAQDIGGVHGMAGMAGSTVYDEEWDWNSGYYGTYRRVSHSYQSVSLGLGFDFRVTPHSKFIAEYLFGGHFMGSDRNLSLLNFGFRLHGRLLSADICGVRPFIEGEDIGDLFLYPMINVGYRF